MFYILLRRLMDSKSRLLSVSYFFVPYIVCGGRAMGPDMS